MKPLRIGIDASSLAFPFSGIGRYTSEVLSRWISTDHHFYLYSTRAFDPSQFLGRNTHLSVLIPPFGIPSGIWFQTKLPSLCSRHRLDAFWSPAHRLPVFLDKSILSFVSIHDLVWRKAPQTMKWRTFLMDSLLMPMSLKRAYGVFSVSNSTKRDILEFSPDCSKKTIVTPLGVMPASHQELPANFLAKEYILFVGTAEPRKNLGRLIDAFSRLPAVTKASFNFVFVTGKGWGGVNLMKLLDIYGLQEQCIVLSNVENGLLSSLYKKAAFVVLPSIYEGFGLPIIEAISNGTPVLTSNLSSMPEVAGRAGLFVDPYSIESISRGLQLLMEDKSFRLSLAEECASQAIKYDWDKTASLALEAIERSFSPSPKKSEI